MARPFFKSANIKVVSCLDEVRTVIRARVTLSVLPELPAAVSTFRIYYKSSSRYNGPNSYRSYVVFSYSDMSLSTKYASLRQGQHAEDTSETRGFPLDNTWIGSHRFIAARKCVFSFLGRHERCHPETLVQDMFNEISMSDHNDKPAVPASAPSLRTVFNMLLSAFISGDIMVQDQGWRRTKLIVTRETSSIFIREDFINDLYSFYVPMDRFIFFWRFFLRFLYVITLHLQCLFFSFEFYTLLKFRGSIAVYYTVFTLFYICHQYIQARVLC